MTSATLLMASAQGVEIEPLGALLRGAISATGVAAVLLAARHWGRDLAGLLTGLPTVTGPALVWLALDRGNHFAEHAALGAIAAAVPCAVFALVYACLSRRCGRLWALFCSGLASLLALPGLAHWQGAMPLTLLSATVACGSSLALMRRALPRASMHAPPPALVASVPSVTSMRAGLITVLVSGSVSALASLLAQSVGAYWAGVMTSLPLLAAAVVLELHRQGCSVRVDDFLQGYTVGLFGRSVFVALLGALLVPKGLPLALVAALGAALLLGWCSLAWMRWRGRLMRLSSPRGRRPAG